MEPGHVKSPYAGFGYNIYDRGLINALHSRAAALHTIRNHLTSLYPWSVEEHHIGYQFAATCGEKHGALCKAHSRRAAALDLRGTLLARLASADITDTTEAQLRSSLVAALTQAGDKQVTEPFGPIFRYAFDRSFIWYGENWPESVGVVIEAIGDSPFPASGFWVNARTNMRVDEPAASPTVHLRLKPERLNLETYAAIFAVLVHELVCHVPATRTRPSNSSPFAEGFCDWAALQLFNRWLDNFDPQFRDAARQFGRQIWQLGMLKGAGNPRWAVRCAGHLAAEHAVDVFRAEGRAATAVDKTVVLARELTVLDASPELKDILVRKLAAMDNATLDDLRRWHDGEATANDLLQPHS